MKGQSTVFQLLLISDASDPIDIASASDFQRGLPGATPEPSSVAAFAVSGLGLVGLMLKARRRAAA